MKKTSFSLITLLLVLTVRGQDSSRIDIGSMSLDRGSTQRISIKGADLEKMPFVNLGDAIAAWLYGMYTNQGMLAYVVDGSPVTDVNMYPIYDVEDVTLVEQAAGAAGYGATQQQLVVIRTRRGAGKQGFRAAAQTGLVNRNGNGLHTFNNFYHQYYIGAYRNFDNLSYGLSADWVRDVFPVSKGVYSDVVRVETPVNLQRWRLNGYLSWRLSKKNVIELRMGYSPQVTQEAVDSSFGGTAWGMFRGDNRSHLVAPRLEWKLDLAPGLRNEFQAVYAEGSAKDYFSYKDTANASGVSQADYGAATSIFKASQLLLMDRIAYDWQRGGWRVGTAVDISYDHVSEKYGSAANSVSYNGYGPPPGFTNPTIGPLQTQKGDILFLTPAVDIGFGRMLDIQIGARLNMRSSEDSGASMFLPFASIGLDVLQWKKGGGDRPSWRFFGSYAQRALAYLDDYSLFDFSGGGGTGSVANLKHPADLQQYYTYYTATGSVTVLEIVPYKYPQPYWTWEAGSTFTTANGRLQLQYTYEKRVFSTDGEIGIIGPPGSRSAVIVPSFISTLHHVDVRWKVLDSKDRRWLTGINLALLKSAYDDQSFALQGQPVYNFNVTAPIGDFSPGHFSWTGGWINRFQLGNFTAGLDLLYHFQKAQSYYTPFGFLYTVPKLNTVALPNIYVGRQWRLHGGTLELFLESRGLVRSKTSEMLDGRRYYTIGGSYAL